MAKLVSKTYGEALFELALEEDRLDSLLEETEAVLQVFAGNEDFIRLMCYPEIRVEEKTALLEEAFQGRVSDELVGFLEEIEKKGRFGEIMPILNYFLDRAREYKRIGVAQVASAVPLSEQQKQEIEKRLLETTDYQSFCMEFRTDKSLLGGLVIRIGDRVLDSSIKTKLANMARDLSKLQLSKE